jgi:ankyrin repeat protein
MIAATTGDTEAVKQIIAAGADVNARNRFGSTALMGAAAGGHADIVAELLARKAQVNVQDPTAPPR